MKVCVIIAEFNPFHNGHKYLIEKVKNLGYTHIIIIMSGNFVQRGEFAIFSKEFRAKTALEMGANLVIEMPSVKVLNTAEKYALNAMEIVKNINFIDAISFGVETKNISNLYLIKDTLKNKNFNEFLKKELNKGLNFASSRENALKEIIKNDEIIKDIKSPNNILAIEYLKSIDKLNLNLKLLPIKRLKYSKNCTSATNIRSLILHKNLEYKKYMPMNMDITDANNFNIYEKAILCKLRSIKKDKFSVLPDISEGIENRIYKAVQKSCSLNELFENIKTKRYTLSRIKRILLCAFLDINKKMCELPIQYLKILASDKKGFEILKKINFPIVTKYSEVLSLGEEAKNFFEIESKCTDLYNTLNPKISPCEKEKTFKLIKG